MSTSWNEFLSVLAQASVSMLALLFVTFQISRERWVGEAKRRFVAIQTLLEFFVPSFFSLIALLPINPFLFGRIKVYHWQLAGFLFSCCGLGIAVKILLYNRKHLNETDKLFKNQVKLQPVSLIEYLFLLCLSLAGNFLGVTILMIWLLISGSYETWLFFTELDKKPDSSIR